MSQGQGAIRAHNVTHVTFIYFIQISTSVRQGNMTVKRTQYVRITEAASDADRVVKASVLTVTGRDVEVTCLFSRCYRSSGDC